MSPYASMIQVVMVMLALTILLILIFGSVVMWRAIAALRREFINGRATAMNELKKESQTIIAHLKAKQRIDTDREDEMRRWHKEDCEIAQAARESIYMQMTDIGVKADLAYRTADAVNQKIEHIGVQMKDKLPLDVHEPLTIG